MAIPIPTVAVLGVFGRPFIIRFADPTVSELSIMGNAITFGEYDLIALTIILGTAVYTRSAPARKALSDARRGAP
jgi:hypothetical protein